MNYAARLIDDARGAEILLISIICKLAGVAARRFQALRDGRRVNARISGIKSSIAGLYMHASHHRHAASATTPRSKVLMVIAAERARVYRSHISLFDNTGQGFAIFYLHFFFDFCGDA